MVGSRGPKTARASTARSRRAGKSLAAGAFFWGGPGGAAWGRPPSAGAPAGARCDRPIRPPTHRLATAECLGSLQSLPGFGAGLEGLPMPEPRATAGPDGPRADPDAASPLIRHAHSGLAIPPRYCDGPRGAPRPVVDLEPSLPPITPVDVTVASFPHPARAVTAPATPPGFLESSVTRDASASLHAIKALIMPYL